MTACQPNVTSVPTPTAATPTATETPTPRWVEYEKALAASVLEPEDDGLCEWIILGQKELEVYVWVICETIEWGGPESDIGTAGSTSAVIYLSRGWKNRSCFFRIGSGGRQTIFPYRYSRPDPQARTRF